MPIIATANSDKGKDFDPAPPGVHQAVCVDVVDLGVLQVKWQGEVKEQHKIRIAWQIGETRDDGKPFLVNKRYTLSLHEKANLRKDLESWRGKPFTAEECAGFDIEKLLDKNCLLNIQHTPPRDGKVYANVVSIMPTLKSMPVMVPNNYIRVQDRTDKQATPEEVDEDLVPF
jgi:hypothetical protein